MSALQAALRTVHHLVGVDLQAVELQVAAGRKPLAHAVSVVLHVQAFAAVGMITLASRSLLVAHAMLAKSEMAVPVA